jgi:hypothetical protein
VSLSPSHPRHEHRGCNQARMRQFVVLIIKLF